MSGPINKCVHNFLDLMKLKVRSNVFANYKKLIGFKFNVPFSIDYHFYHTLSMKKSIQNMRKPLNVIYS